MDNIVQLVLTGRSACPAIPVANPTVLMQNVPKPLPHDALSRYGADAARQNAGRATSGHGGR